MTLEEAAELRRTDPASYVKQSMQSMARHVESMLKNGLDRLSAPEPEAPTTGSSATHENIRGGGYYDKFLAALDGSGTAVGLDAPGQDVGAQQGSESGLTGESAEDR